MSLLFHVDVFIPKEIIRRGKKEVYLRALRKGKDKNTHCNLIVLGQERVGKTSLIKSILGEDFDKNCEPTQGVRIARIGTQLTEHIHIRASESSEDEEQPWAYRSVEQHTSDQISHTIAKELRDESAIGEVSRSRADSVEKLQVDHSLKRIDEIANAVAARLHEEELKARSKRRPDASNSSLPDEASKSQIIQGIGLLPVLHSHPTGFQIRRGKRAAARARVAIAHSEGPRQPTTRINVPREITTPSTPGASAEPLVRTPRVHVQPQISYREGRKTVKLFSKSAKSLDPTFHTIDFAGQKHYRPMHHCFITHRALYIVAFKLPEVVKSIRQPSGNAKGPLEELQYWLNNIYAHASSSGHEENSDPPKIFLIGTHKCPSFVSPDENDVTEDELELVNQHLKNMLLLRKDDRFLYSIVCTDDDKCFFALENSMTPKGTGKRKESGIIPIQKKLKKIVSGLKFFKIDIPINWIKFEKKLMDVRTERISMPLSTTHGEVRLWAEDCGMDEEQFLAAMQYFHDIRIIIDQGMCSSVSPLQFSHVCFVWISVIILEV